MKDLERKQQLFHGCKVLNEFGIYDEQGHLSARSEPGSNSVFINEFTSPGTAGLQEFVKFDLDDEEYPEDAPAETTIHAQIFRNRDDVNAICHNHSPYAVTVASAGLDIRPVHHVGAVQVDPVDVYEDYDVEGGMLITKDEEGQDIADALGDNRALVLRGHGSILVGETITEAVMASMKLEYNCRMLYRQAVLGEPWYLPQEQLEATEEFMYTEAGLEKSLDWYLTESY